MKLSEINLREKEFHNKLQYFFKIKYFKNFAWSVLIVAKKN